MYVGIWAAVAECSQARHEGDGLRALLLDQGADSLEVLQVACMRVGMVRQQQGMHATGHPCGMAVYMLRRMLS